MKKKVLFLIHTLQVGGAEKVLVNLVNKMDKNKFDITVMTVINTGAFRNELNNDIKYDSIIKLKILNKINRYREKIRNVEKSGNLFDKKSKVKEILAKIYKMFWRNIDISWVYKKTIKDRYDIEIAFLEGIATKIIANSNNERSKKIAWIHVDLLKENKTDKFFKNINEEKETYNKFNKIVCVSEIVEEQFEKKLNYDFKKVCVKYNPIDQINIKNKALEEIKIVKKRFTFCTIGRLSTQKGYDRLIKVVSKLNKYNLEFDVWIIGVGIEEEKLKKLILKLNTKNVKLLGYKQNPYPYIKLADCFVCSSRAEGFSTVVSEAIILEKPIITTQCSGMEELLGKNSEYGLICENSEEALYEAMYKFITNRNVIEKYEKNIKDRKKIFDIDKSVKEIEKLINQ